MEGLNELTTLFRTVPIPSPTSYGLPFPEIGGSQPQPKTAIAIISANLADIFSGPSEQKPMKN